MDVTRLLMTDPRAAELHRRYSIGMMDYASYRARIVVRAAELAAEGRGQARRRLLRAAMTGLRRGLDQEDMIRMVMDDATAQRLEPGEDDRYYWARGIVNFCETALGWRDKF